MPNAGGVRLASPFIDRYLLSIGIWLKTKEKEAFISNKIESSASCKELFHVTNQLLGKAKNCTYPDCIPIHELPDAFSTFFTDKIMKISSELYRTPGCPEHTAFRGTPLSL